MKKMQIKSKKTLIVLLIAVLALLALLGEVLAKYLLPMSRERGQAVAEKCYFTADLLGDTKMIKADGGSSDVYAFGPESTEGTWLLYGGVEHKLTINVQNYFDDERITDYVILYKVSSSVTVPEGSDSYKGSIVLSEKSGTLPKSVKSAKALTVTIPAYTDAQYDDGTVVTVVVQSTKPYTKELTLHFKLYSADANLRYKVIDSEKSPYAELVIMAGAIADPGIKPVLKWANALSIDNTNPLTFTMDEGGNITQQPGMPGRNMELSEYMNAGRSESIYFFKADKQKNYTTEEKIVLPDEDGTYTIDLTALIG